MRDTNRVTGLTKSESFGAEFQSLHHAVVHIVGMSAQLLFSHRCDPTTCSSGNAKFIDLAGIKAVAHHPRTETAGLQTSQHSNLRLRAELAGCRPAAV